MSAAEIRILEDMLFCIFVFAHVTYIYKLKVSLSNAFHVLLCQSYTQKYGKFQREVLQLNFKCMISLYGIAKDSQR